MKKVFILSVLICAAVLLISSNTAFAKFYIPPIFGDNMVLQRDIRIPVYGTATAGERIEITFLGGTYHTTTGADGKWLIKMGSANAGGPFEMTITADDTTLNFKNILIGDVWLASGQSNMEFGIQTEKNGKQAIAEANDDQIHLFYVPMALSLEPLYDMHVSANSPNARWIVCSPQAMADPKFAWHGISAVAYYFALQMRKTTRAPLGLIGSYRGGTPVQAWISAEGLMQEPAFTKYADIRQKLAENFESATAAYPQRLKLYQDSLKIWNAEVGTPYNEAIKQWNADVAQAKASGQTAPPRPKPSRPVPVWPVDPLGGYGSPTICFNGVIAPLVGYGLKGVLWYQGETNGDKLEDAVEYQDLFPRMINDWRAKWGIGNFPFLFVQLPNFRAPAVTPSEGNWPWVRESQEKTLAVAKTGMAVITDAGEATDIHPSNKIDPGNRLALIARHLVYGEHVVYSGPIYKDMKVSGNKIIISFDEVNKGLVAGRPAADGSVTEGQELKGFGIAGADQKFVWAKAIISGDKIIVTADGIDKPEAVRYNWADNPPGNLYNKDGLPARPFRTDVWQASN